jgi:hypothetical protein
VNKQECATVLAEARANIEHLAKGIPGSMADRVRAGEADDPRVSLIVRLADALEAAEVRAEQLARLHEVATDRTVQFAAVIEKAKAVWHDPDNHAFGVKAHRILESADTSAVLRARDAEKWDEGFNDCAKWWEIHHHGQVRDESNPYRQQEGADRG